MKKKLFILFGIMYVVLISLGFRSYGFFYKHPQTIKIDNINNIKEYLETSSFEGEWKEYKEDGSDEPKRKAILKIFTETNYFAKQVEKEWVMEIQLQYNAYRDQQMIWIKTGLEIDNTNGLRFNLREDKNIAHTTTLLNKYQKQDPFNYQYEGSISFNERNFDKQVEADKALNISNFEFDNESIQVELKSLEKSFPFDIKCSFHLDKTYKGVKITIYNMFIMTILTLNWIGAFKIIDNFENDRFSLSLSTTTLAVIFLQDSFIFLFHLNFGVMYVRDLRFFLIAIMAFVLCIFVDHKIFTRVWWDINKEQHNNENTLKKKWFYYQLRIFMFFLVYNYLMFKFFIYEWFLFLHSIVLFPQIIHNVFQRGNPSFNLDYLLSFCMIKYLFFYYLRGIPNVFEIKPAYIPINLGLGISVLSILFIYGQYTKGSRFLIPNCLKKQPYQYMISINEYRKVSKEEFNDDILDKNFQGQNCNICFESLIEEEINERYRHKNSISCRFYKQWLKGLTNSQLMRTPCQHTFHPSCLLKWMEIRMMCPCCRTKLPNID